MNAPARKIPLHLREQSKKADLVTENLRRVREARDLSELNGSEPPAPPRVAIVESRPTIIEEQPPLEQQPLAPEPEPLIDAPIAGDPTSAELEELRAQLQHKEEMLNRAKEDQRSTAVRANNLDRQLGELQRQLAQVTGQLQTLQHEQEMRQAQVVSQADIDSRFTADEQKKYGIDYCTKAIQLARTEARAAARTETRAAEARIQTKVDALGADNTKSREDALFATLDSIQAINGWRQIDKTVAFKDDFLSTRDPLTGSTYKDLLYGAYNAAVNGRLNIREAATRCSEVFKKFIETQPKPAARQQPAGAQPAPKPPAAGAGLPQRTQPGATLSPQQRQAKMAEFKITKDPKRKAALEAELRSGMLADFSGGGAAQRV